MAAVAVAVIAAVVWYVRRPRAAAPGSAQQQQQQQQRPIPVVTGVVQQRDLPLYLDGLGSVIAAKTVTVRPQVDGRLDAVVYREGQVVRRGQVLAQIDPRPFQVQLKQAEGALARDAAQLKTARITLERNQDLLRRKLIAPQDVDNASATVLFISQLPAMISLRSLSISVLDSLTLFI